MTQTNLDGRLALVSGASRGIGRAMALELAKAGAHVIATARTTGGLEELDDDIVKAGGSCTIVPLDLMSPDGIEKLGGVITERWEKLDILLANAGSLGVLTPASQVKSKTWHDVIGVNLMAPARMIRAFEPLLLASDAGRAVFISSGAASSRRAFWAPYAASKAALDALVESWANEHVNNPNIRINTVYPGALRTQMRSKAFPGENPDTLPEPSALWPTIAELVSPDCTRNGETVKFDG
ncbi:SDR family NAD(P)-dependent oxidoreductase [Maricaulis sp.]|uniref:SDR family NAD(P)-dependent oxidoreductase n=1 Tax=Maricaulis sp. TaxID=1486257 RepID=UPI000C683ABC|nr:SDR family NAD(P)-dependent oxidoreductase [Maricaulis sp.]MAC89281.1 oxidoreductase [Maricaulis sp.]